MTNLTKPEKLKVDDLFMRAFALFKSGHYQQAVHHFRMVTLLEPLEGRFWISLGHAIRKTGDLKEALKTFMVALRLGQDKDKDLWLTVAECLQDQGLKEQADSALDEAISLAAPPEKKRLELIKERWCNEGCYGR